MTNNPYFAGYVVKVAAGSATSAAAQFKVPRLSCTTAYRAIAPGVAVDVNNFRSVSAAFAFTGCHLGRAVFFLGVVINGNEVDFNNTRVRAGDVIKVSVKVTTGGTTVQVTDVTTGVTKRRTGPGASSSDAEFGDAGWSVGATNVLLGVPGFGTLTYTSCLVDGRALARAHPVQVRRVNSRNVVQIATGALSPGGTAFATHYKHF